MNNKIHVRRVVLALLTVVVLLLSACSSNSNANAPTTTTTHTTKQFTNPPSHLNLITGPITYVALGASDAVGVGSDQPGAQGYVPLLAARLPQGSHMINLGISGIHLHAALTAEVPIALATSPQLITIWLVANDFVGGVTYSSYIQDLNTLLSQLRNRTHANLVMANLPDLTRLPAFSNLNATQRAQMLQQIQHWNGGIAELASQYNVTQVDLFSHGSQLTAHPEYISGDGFHPSPTGYVQLANIFWQAIHG